MELRFDHLGVIVKSLEIGREHLNAAFGVRFWTREFNDPINCVNVQFGRDPSGFSYETIAPIGSESPILHALKTGGRILNHVAYVLPNLDMGAQHLLSLGYSSAGAAKPAVAFGGSRIQFFASPLRFIVELIEAPNHNHQFESCQ